MKIIVLIRHAHRDTSHREDDNGLSEKGEKQALQIREHYLTYLGNQKAAMHTSPKRRCRQTLEPLAKALGLKAEVQPILDEGADPELVARWIEKQNSEILILCSHGDILPDLSRVLLGGRLQLNFKKSSVAVIVTAPGEIPELRHFVQKPGGI